MSLYVWKMLTQPNSQEFRVVASTIESATALALGRAGGQGRVIGAIRDIQIDAVEEIEQKGHPYR